MPAFVLFLSALAALVALAVGAARPGGFPSFEEWLQSSYRPIAGGANYIPIAGTPDAAGGYLIQPDYANPLIDQVALQLAVRDFLTVERTATRKRIYPRMVGRPTATFQGEAADGGVSGAEFNKIEINVKKISTTILYTEEELEDAYANPELLVGPKVEEAFAVLIDAHVLGVASGTPITTSFDASIWGTLPAGAKVEYDQTKQDALALATSAGMGYVEGNGGTANAIALANDARQSIRDARDTTGRPLYSVGQGNFAGPGPERGDWYGLRSSFTTNLDGFPAGANSIVAIGGDWSHGHLVMRRDMSVKVLTEATINDGTSDHRLAQRDEIGVKYTMRVGFNVHQGDTQFFAVKNAT